MNYRKPSLLLISGMLVFGAISVAGLVQADAAGKNAVTKKQETVKQPLAQKKNDIKATFIELGSVNCIPSKMMKPVMADIEKEYGDQVKVVFYDVWTSEGEVYGKQYQIRAIPTQVFLDKNGKEFFRHQGFYPKEDIIKVLQKQGVK